MELIEKNYENYENSKFYGIITSLSVFEEFLFIGIGNRLNIIELNTNKSVFERNMFEDRKITKTQILNKDGQNYLFVVGEDIIKIAQLFNNNFNDLNFVTLPVKDYVLDVVLINNNLYIGSTNNYLSIYNFDNVLHNIHLNKIIFCPEKCICYSLKIFQFDNNTIKILSGSVFRQIIVWSINPNNLTLISEEISILKGHEGVIFSLNIINKNTFLSTSDDRTTKLWKINEKADYDSKTFYGHTARVWNSVFDPEMNIICSVGEDTKCRIFSFESTDLLLSLGGHIGRNVKCVSMSKKYLITGGDDGQVIKYDLGAIYSKINGKEEERDLNCFYENELKNGRSETVKIVKIITIGLLESFLFYGTSLGKIYFVNLNTKEEKLVYDDLKQRVINSIFTDIEEEIHYFGLSDGAVVIYNNQILLKEVQIFPNIRVTFIQTFHINEYTFYLFANPLGQIVLSFTKGKHFEILDFYNNSILFSNRIESQISSAVLFSKNNTYHLIFGNYDGDLLYHNFQIQGKLIILYKQTNLYKFHKDKVSTISLEDNNIITSSRDGDLKYIIIKEFYNDYLNHKYFGLKECNSKSFNKVKSIDFHLFNSENEYIIGFNGRNLLVCDTNNNNILLNIDAKGNNRPLYSKMINKLSNI